MKKDKEEQPKKNENKYPEPYRCPRCKGEGIILSKNEVYTKCPVQDCEDGWIWR